MVVRSGEVQWWDGNAVVLKRNRPSRERLSQFIRIALLHSFDLPVPDI